MLFLYVQMMYLCRRLPALLSDAPASNRLGCLPLHLLLELLASEDLAVDSVRGVGVVWEGLWGSEFGSFWGFGFLCEL